MEEPKPVMETLNVFNSRLKFDTYLKFRREKNVRNSWRFYGYGTTSNIKYYRSRAFDFSLMLERDRMGYYLWAGTLTGRFFPRGIGVMGTEREALKMLKIAQDFTTTYNWSWDRIVDEYRKQNALVDNQSNFAARPDKVDYKERMTDSEIRELYNEVYAAVNQKYPLRKPPLRIIHRISGNYGVYRINKNIVYVHSALTESGLRDTMIHELAHALVHQRHLESKTRSHGYYFLQFYKVLSGQDYIEDQDAVIAEEKAQMRPKDSPDYTGVMRMIYTQK